MHLLLRATETAVGLKTADLIKICRSIHLQRVVYKTYQESSQRLTGPFCTGVDAVSKLHVSKMANVTNDSHQNDR